MKLLPFFFPKFHVQLFIYYFSTNVKGKFRFFTPIAGCFYEYWKHIQHESPEKPDALDNATTGGAGKMSAQNQQIPAFSHCTWAACSFFCYTSKSLAYVV